MTRSCGRVLMSKASGLNGSPGPARASTPEPESICLNILCLLVAAFTLFTFKVIIDMYDPSGKGNGNPLQYLLPGKSHGCQEPPREIPPMTRSCGRELLSKASELNGLPRLSRASTQKP